MENPYGDSLHVICYDEGEPAGCTAFWRNDLDGLLAYNCADLAVLPTHQRKGIFHTMESGCVERLQGSYIYNIFSNETSLAGFYRFGWNVRRKAPIRFHLASSVLKKYENLGLIEDKYVQWRFVDNPTRQYYVCYLKGQPFLVSKRRDNFYLVAGMMSRDFGLPRVRPWFLFSYDIQDLPFRLPRQARFFIENPRYIEYSGILPAYRSDVL